MTIKTPVRITYKANTRGFASYPHFVDADGYHVEFSALAAALNASTAAPDLTALREAREISRSAQADMDGEVPGTEEWFAERDAVLAAREDVLDAVDLLLEKDDTP